MFELKVKSRFAGAHQLAMVGQKCENLHGHNWQVEVCVKGPELNAAGVLADFGDIKRAVRQVVDGDLAKVMRCYDNERRYAHQVLIEAIRLAAGRRHEAVS